MLAVLWFAAAAGRCAPAANAQRQVWEPNLTNDFIAVAHVSLRGGEPVSFVVNEQEGDSSYVVRLGTTASGIHVREVGIERALVAGGGLTAGAHTVELVRTGVQLRFFADGILALRADDDLFHGGALATVVPAGCSVDDVRVQELGDLYFGDDFMRTAEEEDEWNPVSGNWHVNTLHNPTLSHNAFSYVAQAVNGTGALSTAGEWFWRDYTARVAVRGDGTGAIGLCVYYRDPNDYYLVRWEPMDGGRRRQLIRRWQGKDTVLAEDRIGGYLPDQWYEIRASVTDERIRVSFDGAQAFDLTDPHLLSGAIALYTECRDNAQFDDVLVSATTDYQDPLTGSLAGCWTQIGGSWDCKPTGLTASGTGSIVFGSSRWRNSIAEVDIAGLGAGSAGICARYQDDNNYDAVMLDGAGKTLSLVQVRDGTSRVLATTSCLIRKTRPDRLRLAIDDGYLRAAINGVDMLVGVDTAFADGKSGLITRHANHVKLGNWDVTPTPDFQRRPVYTAHEVFSHEVSMENWAAAQSDWVGLDDLKDKDLITMPNPVWHRALIFGDCDVRLDLSGLPLHDGTITCFVDATKENPASGYTVAIDHGATVRLSRDATSLDEGTLPPGSESLVIQRRGSLLGVLAGGKYVIMHRDSQPPGGSEIGWQTSGLALPPERIRLFSSQVYSYMFKKAPDDWRTAGGIWEVTNRWECDPRWSFFSGRSDKLAVIWNKRKFRGDLSLEFCGGPKMDTTKGQRENMYASDINATICADGKDLTSGYSFIFGGWHNQYTRIMKGDKVVAETKDALIPGLDVNIHRTWFYINIRKTGNHLEFLIDNKKVLEYDDPHPLTGDRVALWTYDNGLMLARARICSEYGGDKEQLIADPNPHVRCVYDEVSPSG